jgi:hypothetical protein
MATMIPDVPVTSRPDAGEARVYLALKGLPDAYRIYHSVSYYVAPEGGRPLREGEIDFLILHPEKGLLVLEVKGGSIGYDGREREWTSCDHSGTTHTIQDPFRQGQQNEKSLMGEIERRGLLDDGGPRFAHGHAVIFPDCQYDPERLPISAPRELVIDAGDLDQRAENAVERLFRTIASGREPEPMTKKLVKQIGQQVIAPHFQLVSTLLGDIAAEDAALVRLGEEQAICLDFLDLNPRVHVEGGAGTGKTMLACEIARRMAADGASVLLLCFNTPLAHRLDSFAEAHRSEAGTIWAGSFHQLCRDWTGRAGLAWKEPANSRTAEAAQFWNDESGLLLLDAAKTITDRFDALVIDEAQDFMPDWFEILISLLRDPSRARVYVFRDENQDLWNRNGKPPWPMPRFPLRTNRRNTRAIGEYFSAFVGLDCRYLWSAPAGVDPEIIPYATEAEEKTRAAGKIEWLLKQGVTPDRVVLIGTHRLERSFLRDDPTLAGLRVEAVNDLGLASDPSVLRYSTPHRFKGLEADVVLLCDVDGNPVSCAPRNLYVAASRAKNRLYVFQTER